MIDSLFFFFCIFFSFPLVFEPCRRKYSKIHITSQNLSSASISSFYVYFIYYVTLFQINMKWKSRGNSTWYVITIHRGFRCEHMINGISLSFMFPCAYWLKIIFLNENESKEYNIYTSTPIIHLKSKFLLSFLNFLLLSFYFLKSVLTFLCIKRYSKYSLIFNNTKKKTKAFRLPFSFFWERKVKLLSTFLSFRKVKFSLSFFLGKKSFYFPFLSFLKVKRKWKCHHYL